MKQRVKHLTRASTAISVVLLAYVGFLLYSNYTSQVGLKKSLLERFLLENERVATGLGAFLNSRRADLAALASSREIEAFLGTGARDPGVRRRAVEEKLSAIMDRYRFGADQPYDRIVLIDATGELAAGVRSGPTAPPLAAGRQLLEPRHRLGAVLARDGGEILVSAACYAGDRYAGQLVARLRLEFLFDYVLAHPPGSRDVTYLLAGPDVISDPRMKGTVPAKEIEPADTPVEFSGPWRGGGPERLVAARTLVMNSPFSVVTAAPARDVHGALKPGRLLIGALGLAVAILGSALFILRLKTRSQVLAARLEDSQLHREEVTKKNRQLETEIAERVQAEKDLRRSEERYRTLIETSPDIIYTVSAREGTITSLNSAFEATTGWMREAWIGRSFYDLVHPEDRDLAVRAFEDVLGGADRLCWELRCLTAAGEYLSVEITASPLRHDGAVTGGFGVARDVTERKKLEEQLRHAVKMQAVGQLAGGIAHDFNNMLSVIIGYCAILLEDLREDDPLRQYVDLIFSSAERASQLTQNLLTFSRKQVLKTATVDVNAVIGMVEPLLLRLIGERVVMRLAPDEGALPVMGDSVQLEQVLMNLATNARDAMPHGGTLTITTGSVVMDDAFRKGRGFGAPGPYAFIRVSDTGVGLDAAVRERIFEPFFTTKELGKGTGLGLSIVFGIVKQHRGYVEVESAAGKGTTFTVYLPLLSRAEADAMTRTAAAPARGGPETVMLAEDNDEVRAMLARVLQGAGYTVLQARDGEEAVSLFKAGPEAVELLVSDVLMPNRNGAEAFDEMRALRPGLRALFVSGYAADLLEKSGLAGRDAAVIRKPVIPSVLLAAVRELLDRK